MPQQVQPWPDCQLTRENPAQYGKRRELRPDGTWRTVYLHREAWEREHGPIAPGVHILHRCDTPACRNVEHLFEGDAGINMRDAVAKGRHGHGVTGPRNPRRGERNPLAKVTDSQRLEAAAMRRAGLSWRKIAASFGVCDRSVRRWLSERKAS